MKAQATKCEKTTRLLLLVVLSVVCLSSGEGDESRYHSQIVESSKRQRRLKPAGLGNTYGNDGDDESFSANEYNETTIAENIKLGDYDEAKMEKEYEKQLVSSMSFSIPIYTDTKASKKSKNSKESKTSKNSKKSESASTPSPSSSTNSKKSKGSKKDDSSTVSPPSSSKGSKSGKKSSKQSSADQQVANRKYEGNFVQLREYRKSCTSSGACKQDTKAFCMGGMDVVQEFSVQDFGQVLIHLDIAWDFAGRTTKCGIVSRQAETLLGLGWLPVTLANSYKCFTDYIYRIPGSPNLNEQTFTGRFELTMPDGELLEGQLLSGAVCELNTESGVYLDINSYAILAMIPGYSVFLQYDIDERTMQVMELLSGAPHITIQEDDSLNSGRWDYLRPDGTISQSK